MWLGTNVVAYIGHDLCCEISHFIVPDGWESSCVAVESIARSRDYVRAHYVRAYYVRASALCMPWRGAPVNRASR